MKNLKSVKNMVVIYVGCGSEKEKHTIYDVKLIEHVCIDERAYLRVLCDKEYLFKVVETNISRVEIYD